VLWLFTTLFPLFFLSFYRYVRYHNYNLITIIISFNTKVSFPNIPIFLKLLSAIFSFCWCDSFQMQYNCYLYVWPSHVAPCIIYIKNYRRILTKPFWYIFDTPFPSNYLYQLPCLRSQNDFSNFYCHYASLRQYRPPPFLLSDSDAQTLTLLKACKESSSLTIEDFVC
jgi:hypothetical protein